MSRIVQIPDCMNPFVVIVNGKSYSYPAGEHLEVPDEVADVIEAHIKMHKPKHISAPGSPVVARFSSEDGAVLICESHTADEIRGYLNAGTPVLALVNDQSTPCLITCMCWVDESAVYVGIPLADTGWSHIRKYENHFDDGNPENKTIGNELWNEF